MSASTLIIPLGGVTDDKVLPYIFERTPSGNILLLETLKGLPLSSFSKVIIVVQQKICDKYNIKKTLEQEWELFGFANYLIVHSLSMLTRNEPETVSRTIEELGITGPIMVKDADNYFECDFYTGNGACVYPLDMLLSVTPSEKSYVEIDDYHYISNIIEKKIISRFFCAGGYFFESAQEFLTNFQMHKEHEHLYMSHIIYSMLLQRKLFRPIKVESFIDFGTKKDWVNYKRQFKTLYIDIDIARNNINRINELCILPFYRIVITSNKDILEDVRKEVDRIGLKSNAVLCGIFSDQQYIVTDERQLNDLDYNHSNNYIK